jgi:hypothetical protein
MGTISQCHVRPLQQLQQQSSSPPRAALLHMHLHICSDELLLPSPNRFLSAQHLHETDARQLPRENNKAERAARCAATLARTNHMTQRTCTRWW